jgi:nitroreductase
MARRDPEPEPTRTEPDQRGASASLAHLVAVRHEPAPDGDPPDEASLARILAAATTVPDHGNLTPWRFAVFTGTGRDRFAAALVDGLHAARGDGQPDAVVAKMRSKAYAAPCSVVVIASPDTTSNVEVWEQVASAACTGYALVLAATGLGYGAVWKSAGVLDAGPVRDLFGLGPDESLLGWVNIGTPAPLGRKKQERTGADPLAGRVLRFAD